MALTGFTGKTALTSKRAGSYMDSRTENITSRVKTKSYKNKCDEVQKNHYFTQLHNQQTMTTEISFHNLNINFNTFSRDLSQRKIYGDCKNQYSNSKYTNEDAHLLSRSLL